MQSLLAPSPLLGQVAGALVLLATPRKTGKAPWPCYALHPIPSLAIVVAAGGPPLPQGTHRNREGTPFTGWGKSEGCRSEPKVTATQGQNVSQLRLGPRAGKRSSPPWGDAG